MNSMIQEEFNKRQEDIETIIDLVEALVCGTTLDILSEEGDIKQFDYNERLINSLVSVISLITYNQIESTMRGGIEALYDDIADNNISYEELRETIQKEVLSGILRKYESGRNLHTAIQNKLSLKIPGLSLNIKKVFNGNIDSEKVYKVRDTYGLNLTTRPTDRNGVDITDFKDARNDLAHGNISFSEFGSSHPHNEIIDKSRRVSGYLKSVITAFDNCIEEKNYRS